MTGIKMAVALLGLAILFGGTQVQKSVGNALFNDPRVLYLMAEYKMAVGDSGTALRLLKRASTEPERAKVNTNSGRREMAKREMAKKERCPYTGDVALSAMGY